MISFSRVYNFISSDSPAISAWGSGWPDGSILGQVGLVATVRLGEATAYVLTSRGLLMARDIYICLLLSLLPKHGCRIGSTVAWIFWSGFLVE